jgi:hypothetical protein
MMKKEAGGATLNGGGPWVKDGNGNRMALRVLITL